MELPPKFFWIAVPLFLILLITVYSMLIYEQLTLDNDLADPNRYREVVNQLKNEFKELKLPEKTVAYETESHGKQRSSLSVSTRYRTELHQKEFWEHFRNELNRKGWIYYAQKSESPSVKSELFCRGKFDAELYLNSKSIWNQENADYYQLNFRLYRRRRTLTFFETPDQVRPCNK